MDTLRIIEREGYTYSDLNSDNKHSIGWLRFLLEDFDDYEYLDGDINDKDSIIGKIKAEIVGNVVEDIKDWMEIRIAEYQIAMIEGQEEKHG